MIDKLKVISLLILLTLVSADFSFSQVGNSKPFNLDFNREILIIGAGSVQRTRPFVYDDETPIEKKTSTDARTSFFSGHTSITAAISFFTAKVFTEYVDDKTAKILIWSGAVILPAAVALSRVYTNWHFPTDVMAGYVVGALMGYFIPELHKTKVNKDLSIYPSINLNKPTLNVQLKF